MDIHNDEIKQKDEKFEEENWDDDLEKRASSKALREERKNKHKKSSGGKNNENDKNKQINDKNKIKKTDENNESNEKEEKGREKSKTRIFLKTIQNGNGKQNHFRKTQEEFDEIEFKRVQFTKDKKYKKDDTKERIRKALEKNEQELMIKRQEYEEKQKFLEIQRKKLEKLEGKERKKFEEEMRKYEEKIKQALKNYEELIQKKIEEYEAKQERMLKFQAEQEEKRKKEAEELASKRKEKENKVQLARLKNDQLLEEKRQKLLEKYAMSEERIKKMRGLSTNKDMSERLLELGIHKKGNENIRNPNSRLTTIGNLGKTDKNSLGPLRTTKSKDFLRGRANIDIKERKMLLMKKLKNINESTDFAREEVYSKVFSKEELDIMNKKALREKGFKPKDEESKKLALGDNNIGSNSSNSLITTTYQNN